MWVASVSHLRSQCLGVTTEWFETLRPQNVGTQNTELFSQETTFFFLSLRLPPLNFLKPNLQGWDGVMSIISHLLAVLLKSPFFSSFPPTLLSLSLSPSLPFLPSFPSFLLSSLPYNFVADTTDWPFKHPLQVPGSMCFQCTEAGNLKITFPRSLAARVLPITQSSRHSDGRPARWHWATWSESDRWWNRIFWG